jgi:nanoRNase/pAp phosphatase (c-di-AMP/oligoRNAs hydrolase)
MIRCNSKANVAAKLAEHFGGGGHPFAAGFKITDGRQFNDVKTECLQTATDLLHKLEQEEA